MPNIIADIIGYVAAVVGTSLMLPQLIKSLKTKKVRDVSFLMLILYFVSCVLWLIYGILISSMPIIVCDTIAIFISITQIAINIKFKQI